MDRLHGTGVRRLRNGDRLEFGEVNANFLQIHWTFARYSLESLSVGCLVRTGRTINPPDGEIDNAGNARRVHATVPTIGEGGTRTPVVPRVGRAAGGNGGSNGPTLANVGSPLGARTGTLGLLARTGQANGRTRQEGCPSGRGTRVRRNPVRHGQDSRSNQAYILRTGGGWGGKDRCPGHPGQSSDEDRCPGLLPGGLL